jgi:DNA mismatch repair protein MutL
MPTIQVLPDDLASQVAAGEVVERPASVVKELIENALDANARNILIQIERGGAQLIRVRDDGDGMDHDDALLSVQRHATSKLRTRADLDRITTLGFRGEAVPSIASVSRFRLMSRRHDDLAGIDLQIEAGKQVATRDYGGPPGTTVEAADLFFCIPGRRKFLRTESTEAGHVEHQVRLHAFAAPQVGFILQKNRREIFRLPPAASLRERVHDLAGSALAAGLVEIPAPERASIQVSGLIGPPAMARKDRQFCLAYLNGRPIDASQISFAFKEAFGTDIERGRSPVAFLFLQIDPAEVDVNVHPTKREVRFRNPQNVQRAIIDAIQHALTRDTRNSLHPADNPSSAHASAAGSPRVQPASSSADNSPPHSSQPSLPPHVQQPRGAFQPRLTSTKIRETSPFEDASLSPEEKIPPTNASRLSPASAAPASASFRVFGSLRNGVAILEGDEGLVLLDLRAAHERILYDEMLATHETHALDTVQPLLVPEIIELGAKHHGLLIEHRTRLGELGFGLEEFGLHTIRLTSLPGFLRSVEPQAQLLAILDDIEQGSRGKGGWEAALARRASREAIAKNASLGVEAISELVESLLGCEIPYCAPDGRPTLMQFSYQELDRRLGRNP